MKLGDDVAASGFEEEEQEALELFVSGFGGVQVGEDSVTAGELGGGHEGAGEDVTLFDFADVEKDREAFGVEQNDDVWIGGDEGAGGHVGAEHGGVVFLGAGLEELVTPLVVEEVKAVFDGSYERETVISWDLSHGKLAGLGRWRSRRRRFRG